MKRKSKANKQKRTWLVYLDEYGDRITLAFRESWTMEMHIDDNKISKDSILYCGPNRPGKDELPTMKEIRGLEELLYCTHPSLDWD